MKFIRNQLTTTELESLRAAWHALKAADRRYHFAPRREQTDALAAAANHAEGRLHALWRSHGWEDCPTFEIGCHLNNEGVI